jgi:hypothetical protein
MWHRLVVLSVAWCVLLTGCSIKSQFIKLAYPDQPAQTAPSRDWPLSVAATLVPWLTIGYDNPQAVGTCLDELVVPTEALGGYGQCLANTPNGFFVCGARHLWQHVWQWDGQTTSPSALRCAVPVDRPDQLRLAVAIADVGEVLYTLNFSVTGRLGDQEVLDERIRSAVPAALRVAVQTLKATPPTPVNRPGNLPVLSLSGGAANGAFTAGYLYTLLLVREVAIARAIQQGDPALLTRIEQAERFDAAVGTSAGTLAALLVDLYFASNQDLPPGTRPALDRCLAERHGEPLVHASRPVQACALGRLRTDFIQEEWQLFCAVNGSILDLFQDTRGALRFDPLLTNFLQPFFTDFGQLILHNDFLRVAMTVDLEHNVLVGLDERVCRWAGMDPAQCLSTGVMASIVEPVFAEPVQRVFAGVHGGNGEVGTWVDGGLRSGTPAARAAMLARFRPLVVGLQPATVLALNTHRAEGIVSSRPAHGIAILFGTLGAFVEQTRQWELAYAQLLDTQRRTHLCDLEQGLGMERLFCIRRSPPAASHLPHPEAVPGLRVNEAILPVFVPEDITPPALFAEGYTFDPLIIQGLFWWGQRVFLESAPVVLERLGWSAVWRLVTQPGLGTESTVLDTLLATVQTNIDQLAVQMSAPGWQQQRRAERRAVLRDRLSRCQ